MATETLQLLAGTGLTFGATQSILLPEVYEDINIGDLVQLTNEAGEFLGVADVKDVLITNFSLLQHSDFLNNAHPLMLSWPNAHELLINLVPGFSQSDRVTVLRFVTETMSSTGVTVSVTQKVEPEVVPDVMADLTEADVDEFATIVEVVS